MTWLHTLTCSLDNVGVTVLWVFALIGVAIFSIRITSP